MKSLILSVLILASVTGCKSLVTQSPQNPGVYYPAAWATNTIALVSAANQAAPQGPWTPIITGALGAVSLALGAYATNKSNKNAAAHAQLVQQIAAK